MSNFVDRAKITCKAGNGGNGSVSFHREKFVQNGGPDGGDGGTGGDISFYADPNMHTLLDFRFKSKYTAGNGGDGAAARCKGKRGDSVLIKVPVGTLIRNAETGAVVADMDVPEETRVLLRGGRGGWGNAHFATPTRQAPNFARPGIKTEVYTLQLELKTMADIGLVGYPNVGKSTILSVLTAARPKIANYHFTTLSPNLGICRRYGVDFILADIPGLIQGASEGAGLGFRFLQHVERTRMLLHVVDISGSEGRDPVEDFEQITDELAAYGGLAERPTIVAANKMDLPETAWNLERLRAHLAGTDIEVIPISAATGEGIDELMNAVIRMLPTLPETVVYEEEADEEEAGGEPFTVTKEDGLYVVSGPLCERLLAGTNFDSSDSAAWFHRSLRSRGVIDALRAAGAREGDTVLFGDMEFDFVE